MSDVVLRLRGLPYSARADEITKFFSGIDLKQQQLVIGYDGRPTGQAYVVLQNPRQLEKAMQKHKEMIGRRWVEVNKASMDEFISTCGPMNPEMDMSQPAASGMGGPATPAYSNMPPPAPVGAGNGVFSGVVRLRGLPFDASRQDVVNFFAPREGSGNAVGVAESDVYLMYKPNGRPRGEAFVVFPDEESLNDGMSRDKEKISGRWIELFPSTQAELHARAGPAVLLASQPDSSYRGVLKMRGLPFSSTWEHVADFFMGYEVEENGIFLVNGADGRPSGDAFVVFKDEDAASSAQQNLDRAEIGGRWINLTVVSKMDLFQTTMRSPMFGMGGGAAYSSMPLVCARLRGVPFQTSDEDVTTFFQGMNVQATLVVRYPDGRGSGDAFARFASPAECQQSLAFNRRTMGTRYVEVYPATAAEMDQAVYGGGDY